MKILFHTPTATLRAYPRAGDEPVIGLDPDYQVFDLVQEAQPEHDNSSTHYLRPRQTIDVPGRKVTRGWDIIAYPPEPPCPPSVSSVKLLHILVEEGLYAVCTATINSIPDPIERQKAQITFLREPTIARNHPLVALVANAAGKTDAEIDDYFRRAA